MSQTAPYAAFSVELERQLDQLIEWTVLNIPDKNLNLSKADFAGVREAFSKIANGTDELANQRRDPSHGGAQYVNVTPAPWP